LPWTLHYIVSVPQNIVRANLLVYLEKAKVRANEFEEGVIEIRPLEHILFAKHPLACISKGKIILTKSNDDITDIQINIHPNSLRAFALLFPTLFILSITFFGHWVAEIPIKEIVGGLWTIYVCVIGGSYLIYLLIKQSIINYFNKLIEDTRSLLS
jgi:hypothetical protein